MKAARDKHIECILIIAACFMLFIYAPIELYVGNKESFWFDVYNLFAPMFVVFIVAGILGIAVFKLFKNFLSAHIYDYILGIFAGFYLCAYIQGNYMNKYLPGLDGNRIDWKLYSQGRIPSMILWLFIPFLVVFLYKKFGNNFLYPFIQYLSLGISCILMITLFTLGILNDGFEKKSNFVASTDGEFEMSTDTNFIILILDSFNASAFDELGDKEKGDFSDFTFYRNTLGGYPVTKNSVPLILSGMWYENKSSYQEFLNEAYEKSPLLNRLADENYLIGIYEEESLLAGEGMDKFVNVSKEDYGISSYTAFVRWQFLLVGYIYAPHDLKRFCFLNPDAFQDIRIATSGKALFSSSNYEFYNMCINTDVTYTDQKSFRFIHLRGAHLPVERDKNMKPLSDGTYQDGVDVSMMLAGKYLQKLREANVYDNSVIIIMADHGFNENGSSSLWNRQNPLLLIKGKNEKHDLVINDAPISFDDLQNGYARLMDEVPGNEIFDVQEEDYRERRYLYYEDWRNDNEMEEYISNGKASDSSALKKTGMKYILQE